MVCEVAEGTVHRLWEPLAAKQKPAERLCRQVQQPYCVADGVGARRRRARAISPTPLCATHASLALAAKVRYRIDPGQSLS